MASDLILRPPHERTAQFRDADDYDVWCEQKIVGRVFRPSAGVPADTSWMWSITTWPTPATAPQPHRGYGATREEAMAAFAKSWGGRWLNAEGIPDGSLHFRGGASNQSIP
jgi:hypothetical protein